MKTTHPPPPQKDLLSALLHDRHSQPLNLEFGEIFAEANVILNAGSDSTGIAMTNVIYSPIQHPRVLAKLRREIDIAVPDIRTSIPSYELLKNLPYLRACINESIRLNAPSQFSLPRKTPLHGAWMGGYWIAGDTQVTIATHAVHMDPAIWGDPENFRPERWLELDRDGKEFGNDEDGLDLKEFFLVFSKGSRGCIGKHITYMEQTVILAVMVGRYALGVAEEGAGLR